MEYTVGKIILKQPSIIEACTKEVCLIILNNSFKQLRRTPLRTSLFIFFLAAVITLLCFGMYMQASVTESLEQAAAAFTTAAIIEIDYSFPTMADLDIIFDSPYVEHVDHREWLAAYGEGIKPTTQLYISRSDGIIVFEPTGPSPGEYIPIEIKEVLVAESMFDVKLSRIKASGLFLESGKQYIAAGRYYQDIEAFQLEASLAFSPIAELPEGRLQDFLAANRTWASLLDTFTHLDNNLTVFTTTDLNTIYAFNQGDAVLVSGRSFTQEEYSQSAKVCLVSVPLTKENDLQLGDTIDLVFYNNAGTGWRNDTGVMVELNPFSQSIGKGNYEVIGIYNLPMVTREDHYKIDKSTIIIPQDPLISQPNDSEIWPNLLSCRLTNGTAEAFLADIETANLPGVTVAVFDQGYSRISAALKNMGRTSFILMGICLVAGFILAILFAYLYVGKQRRNVAIMYSLGENRHRALGFIIATVGIVAVLATVLGALGGYILADTVLNAVFQHTKDNIADTSYSMASLGTEMQYQVIIPHGFAIPIIAAGMILLLTLILSAIFSINVLRAEPLQLLSRKED